MIRLTVAELVLIREALKMCASRHESFDRWQIKKPRKTYFRGTDHRRKAARMRELGAKLATHRAADIAM